MKMKAVTAVFVAIDVSKHFTSFDLNLIFSARWRTVCSITAFGLNKLQFYHDRSKSSSFQHQLQINCGVLYLHLYLHLCCMVWDHKYKQEFVDLKINSISELCNFLGIK